MYLLMGQRAQRCLVLAEMFTLNLITKKQSYTQIVEVWAK